MSGSPFELCAIDLDGTLVDSVGDLHRGVITMLAALQRPLVSIDEVRHWVGNGVERLVHRALTRELHCDADQALFDDALPLFMDAYAQCNGDHSTLYPGVIDGLDYLQAQGLPLAVVTNKASRFTVPLLEKLGIADRFRICISGDSVSQKKPHPEALFSAARAVHATPAHCLMIGDSVHDIQAARAARFSVICVSYGYNHGVAIESLLELDRPDAIVDSLAELPERLTRLVARY